MSTSEEFQAVILAAGKGTRMKSDDAKVLHEVLGRPMISHSVRAALNAGASRVVVITGYQRERVEGWLEENEDSERVCFAVQEEQLGTGHAVWAAEKYLEDGPAYTAILSGDVPNLDGETLRSFVEGAMEEERPLAMMTADLQDPAAYGRILRSDDGATVEGVVEYTDATPSQRSITEINTGSYVAQSSFLTDKLPKLCSGEAETAQGEYYLTELVEMAAGEGGVHGWQVPDPRLTKGVNTRADLAQATHFLQERINQRWMEEGVTIIDPQNTYIEPDVALAQDVVLYPGVHLRGNTVVKRGTVVENGTVIKDSTIGEDVHVKANCYMTDARVDSDTNVGPFAHLRPGADVGKGCKVGNFVEVKKARLEDGVKAGHLTYLGDAHIGEGTNVGAGTITCNYDGEQKHQTNIGEGAFIGSNTSLVAPVTLGDGAYVGAGSTITEDIPARALGVGRGRQRNIENWSEEQP